MPCCLRSPFPHRPSPAWLPDGRGQVSKWDRKHTREAVGQGCLRVRDREGGGRGGATSFINLSRAVLIAPVFSSPCLPSSRSSPFPFCAVSWSISPGSPLHMVPQYTASSGSLPQVHTPPPRALSALWLVQTQTQQIPSAAVLREGSQVLRAYRIGLPGIALSLS